MNHNYSYKYLLHIKGIYQIRQLSTNKVYIGSAANNFYDRMCAHHSVLKRNMHSSIYLQRAWNKYGKDDFIFEIVEEMEDISNILIIELNYIRNLKSSEAEYGFNMACEVSPNRLGHHQSDHTKQLISNKLTGIKRSAETKEKMSLAKRGENSPSWGKNQAPELVERRIKNNRKRIQRSDGKVYNSLNEAAADIECLCQSISQSLRKGHRCKGFFFFYLESTDE